MKKIIQIFTITIALLYMSMTQIYASSDVYVEDTYGVLSQEEVQELQQRASEVSDKYQFGVYARIIEDDTEESYDNMDEFSERYYQQQNLGYGNTSDGVLLLITQCSQGGSYQVMIPPNSSMDMFTLDGMDAMDEKAITSLKKHDYYQAIYDYINEADSLMHYYEEHGEAYGTNYDYDASYKPVDNTNIKYGCVFCIPLLFASLIVFVLQRKNKTKYTAITANQYVPKNGVHMRNARDMFLYRTVTRTPIPHDNGGSSPGGSHFSSSGGMHSGGGHF